MSDIIYFLNDQAKEIAEAGHYGWGNTMVSAAEEIEKLRQELEAANAAYKFICEFSSEKLKEFDDRVSIAIRRTDGSSKN